MKPPEVPSQEITQTRLPTPPVLAPPVPYVLYSIDIHDLKLECGKGLSLSFVDTLTNGRASYVLFEGLVRNITGLTLTTGSDHIDAQGRKYEQKGYKDPVLYPDASNDLFHTAASNTLRPNNNGPKINALLSENDYAQALAICKTTYDKNHFYIYTNTSGYVPRVPFRFIVIPTAAVLDNLDSRDPRLISRSRVLSLAKSQQVL